MAVKYKRSIRTVLGMAHLLALGLLLLYIVIPFALSRLFGLEGPYNYDIYFLYITGLVSALVGYLLFRNWSLLHRRRKAFIRYGIEKHWTYGESGNGAKVIAQISGTSLPLLPSMGGVKYRNLLASEDGYFADYEFGVYTQTKYYTYKSARILYAVHSLQLPRELPNVLFDSKKSHKSQFKVEFDPKQKHSLEGDFDKYFDTYFPPEYTIDSLSFITPEVMHELIAAADYDIEINGNQLVIFGPLAYDARRQLETMEHLGRTIRKKLLNNILTYRDERLPYEVGRASVSVLGRRLEQKREPIWPFIVAMVAGFIYVLFFVLPNR